MLKNFKYYAGLIDSDGYVGLSFNKSTNGKYSLYATVQLRLREDSAEKVIPYLADFYKVVPYKEEKQLGNPQLGILLSGKKAVRFLNEIKKHSILKRAIMEFVIEHNGLSFNESELPEIRSRLKELRADRTSSKKPFPSRQWVAGYIDGDGCLFSDLTREGYLHFKLCITSHKNDPQGIELIAKYYGGVITIRNDGNYSYVLSVTKSCKLLADVLPHIKIKRAQFDLVKYVIDSGCHLKKNGATRENNYIIHTKLKELKSYRPQRLNETSPEGQATV
jgi:hypothetical protein